MLPELFALLLPLRLDRVSQGFSWLRCLFPLSSCVVLENDGRRLLCIFLGFEFVALLLDKSFAFLLVIVPRVEPRARFLHLPFVLVVRLDLVLLQAGIPNEYLFMYGCVKMMRSSLYPAEVEPMNSNSAMKK